jgi:hypothetical protein
MEEKWKSFDKKTKTSLIIAGSTLVLGLIILMARK